MRFVVSSRNVKRFVRHNPFLNEPVLLWGQQPSTKKIQFLTLCSRHLQNTNYRPRGLWLQLFRLDPELFIIIIIAGVLQSPRGITPGLTNAPCNSITGLHRISLPGVGHQLDDSFLILSIHAYFSLGMESKLLGIMSGLFRITK